MYPKLFGVLDTYMVCIVVGIILCVMYFRYSCKRSGVPAADFTKYLILGAAGLALGAIGASLLQSLYDYIAGREVVIFGGGVTFYGGLIGGIIGFLVLGLIFLKGEARSRFYPICNIAITCVVIAHAFGRIGCFMDGCCYGIHSGTILDMQFPNLTESVLPTQLYEAVFLFALFFVMHKFNRKAVIIYFFSYGIFRFLIEFIRGDYRGALIPGLSPSQLVSILLVIGGIFALIYDYKAGRAQYAAAEGKEAGEAVTQGDKHEQSGQI